MGTAGTKIIVASKLPMALELQHCVKRTMQMKNGNTAWKEDVWVKSGQIVVINGTSYPNGQLPDGMPDRPQMRSGAALTYGVDKDFFDKWLEQNKDSEMVKNGLIFAAEKGEDVSAEARARVKTLSGLEPLNPEGDRRMPKKINGRVGSIAVQGGGAGQAEAAEMAEAGA